VLFLIIEETSGRTVTGLPRLQKELKVREQSLRKVSNKNEKLMCSHGEVERDAQLAITDELELKSKQKAAIELDIVGLKTGITDCTSNKIVAEAVMISLENSHLQLAFWKTVKKETSEGLRISLYGNSALFSPDLLTRIKKCAESPTWRLDRVSQRTVIWYNTNLKSSVKRRKTKIFRNPIIQAKEFALEMELEDLSKADLARKLGISRARVTQILNLLKLPEELIREVEEMGDNWEKRFVTERSLRIQDLADVVTNKNR
jgi:hypothetical protein